MYSGSVGLDVHRRGGHGRGHLGVPVQPAGVVGHRGGEANAALHQNGGVRHPGQAEGFFDGGEVLDPARGFDAAGGRDHRGGGGVADAGGEFLGGEAAEDDGVHGAEPGGGEHRDGRLGDHRHVDHHAVALAHAVAAQDAGEPGDEVRRLRVAVALLRAEHGGVIDQGVLPAPALLHVAVQRVVGRVEHAVGEPVVQRLPAGIQGLLRRGGPGDLPAASSQNASGVSRLRA